MRWSKRLVAIAATMVALTVVPARAAEGVPSKTLTITGNVTAPTTYTPSALQALPPQEVTVRHRTAHCASIGACCCATCSPPRSRPATGRFDLRQSIAVARATDGYLAIFTWAELFNSPIGDGVVVAWSVDGAPLPDAEGAFALVSARDTRAGPRHVRWLESVDFRRVVP